MLPRARLKLSVIGMLTLVSASLRPEEAAWQSLAAIQEQARVFLLAQNSSTSARVEVTVDAPDARLRLAPCDVPLAAFLPPAAKTTGRVIVGVRCSGSSPWSLFLPAQVQRLDQVVVAQRALARDDIINGSDLQLEQHDLTQETRGYFLRLDEVIGQRAARPIPQGSVLNPSAVMVPLAVERGAPVSILANLKGIEVRAQGRALEPGRVGARIRVKNTSSGQEVEARVISAGVVRVDI